VRGDEITLGWHRTKVALSLLDSLVDLGNGFVLWMYIISLAAAFQILRFVA
jgi:hypothetical protein